MATSVPGMIHRDDELEEQGKIAWLRNELRAGTEAGESEFVALDLERLIAAAKKRQSPGQEPDCE